MSELAFAHIEAARIAAGLSIEDLWLAYFGLGGDASVTAVRDHLNDVTVMLARDHDLLVDALNDSFIDQGKDHPMHHSGRAGDDLVNRNGA